MSETLHTKYRPRTFEEVVGQGATVKSLKGVLKRGDSQAFLFSGPSGCGKTTLARIAAEQVGCHPKDVLEIDAATYTGIDAMRQVQSTLQYRPFGKSEARAVIIDECHQLSKQAWQSLLKVIEEPPEHVSWFLCTTEAGRVPATIKTRCASFTLKLVKDDVITGLIEEVMEAEGFELAPEITKLVVKEAHGSPRQALVNLGKVQDCKDRKEVAEVLTSALESDATIELARFLINGGSWLKAMVIVGKLEEENPESVRIVISNYMSAAARGAKSEREALRFLTVLDAFSEPYNASERLAPLLLSIGRVLIQS